MTIIVKCQCGSRLKVPAALLGKAATCGSCRKHVRLVAGEPLSSDEKPNASLIIQGGPSRAGEQIILAGGTSIEVGSAASRHFVIAGDHVERLHCTLTPINDRWRLDDQHSAIGTYVNGERVTSRELRDGDVLDIGAYELKFVQATPAPAKPRVEPKIQVVAGDDFLFTSAPAAPAAVLKKSVIDDDVIQLEEEDDALVNFEPIAPESAGPQLIEPRDAPDDLYDFADPDEPAKPPPFIPPPPIVTLPGHEVPMSARVAAGQMSPIRADRATPTMADIPQEGPQTGGPICPSCEQSLAPRARFCVSCGINICSGRPLLTSHGIDQEELEEKAEKPIWWLSWPFPTGLYPIASEAYGTRRPMALWIIAAFTILWSCSYWITGWTGGENGIKNQMLWPWNSEPDAETIAMYFSMTDFGDRDAFVQNIQSLPPEMPKEKRIMTAYGNLQPDQRPFGEFRWYQLLTHALLHGGLLHLAGNLLFLLVLGTRVNALIGDLATAILYPILAVAAAVAHILSVAGEPPIPMLGASGAIMGLAGMYLVFFPVHRIYSAIWIRWFFFLLIPPFFILLLIFPNLFLKVSSKIFSLRGFWAVLFYIAFDVLYTAIGVKTGTAHWAHLGGFIAGMICAIVLLLSRQFNARGGDILSVILGKYAWPLIGKPSRWKDDVPASMLATRAISLNYPGS